MTDLTLQTAHAPDGSRPLEVGRPSPCLSPTLHEPSEERPLICAAAQWAIALSAGVPGSCRREIQPGDHYLRHTEHDAGDQPLAGFTWAYCAPCAIAEWSPWQVREAAA